MSYALCVVKFGIDAEQSMLGFRAKQYLKTFCFFIVKQFVYLLSLFTLKN